MRIISYASSRVNSAFRCNPTALLLAVTVFLLGFQSMAEARVYKPSPDTNLQDLSSQLKTGDVVKLGPYRYYGQLLIEKKSVTVRGAANGKTRLYDPATQSLVYVGAGGSVVLENLRFKVEGKGQTAVYVKKGKAVMRHCVIKRSAKQPIYVEDGELEIHKCRFSSISEEVISASGNSKVLVQDSSFTDIKTRVIVLHKGAQATIKKSRFVKIAQIAILAIGKVKATIVDSHFTNISNTALHAEQESELNVSSSTFNNVNKFGIIALKKAVIRIKSSQFKNSKGIAIVGNQATEISVADSTFSKVSQVIFVGKQGTNVSISDNKIINTDKDKAAISIESAGSIMVSNNELLNVGEGVSVNGSGSGSSVIENNAIVNSSLRAIVYAVDSQNGQRGSIVSNRLINSRKPAVLFGSKANVNFSKNIVLVQASVATYVRNNANIQFSDNVISGRNKSIVFHSSASPASRLSRNMLISPILKSARHTEIIPDSRFSYLTSDAENKRILNADINKLLASASNASALSDIAKVNADIKSLQARIAGLKSQVGDLATITVKAVDAAGREFTPSYTVYNVYNAVVSRHDSDNPVATVPPGSYYVKSDIGDRSKKDVQLVTGQTAKVSIAAPKYRVLGFVSYNRSKGWNTTWIPFLFKPVAQRKSALAVAKHQLWAVRRSNTTVTDLVGALDQVRKKLPKLRSEYSRLVRHYRNVKSRKRNKKYALWRNVINWAHNVLAIAGSKNDAKQLFELATKVRELRKQRIALAAYIENRLGILGKGSVVSGLSSPQTNIQVLSALALRQFGRGEGDDVLISAVRSSFNSENTALSAKALLRSNKPAVLDAMRQVVQAYIGQRQTAELAQGKKIKYPMQLWDAAATASLYLYTYGTAEDAQLAAKITYKQDQLLPLAHIVSDPKQLASYYLGFRGNNKIRFKPHWVAQLCNNLPVSKLPSVDGYFESLLIKAGSAVKVSKKSRQNDISVARTAYSIAKSQCRASTVTARLVFSQNAVMLKNTPWIAKPWQYNKKLAELKRGNPFAAGALEHAAHGVLAASLSTVKSNAKLRYPDFLLAYHGIGKRHCQYNKCAFVISHNKSPQGTLAGVLRITKVKKSKRSLSVNFHLDLAAHHASAGDSAGQPVSFGKYMAFGGKDLIAEVYVKNSNRKLRLRKVARGSTLKYSLNSKFNLNNAYLYIRVRLFNEWREFGFPLFLYRS